MALATAVKGGLRPSQTITWAREDGNPEDLTGAALSGWIRSRTTGEKRSITGTLTLTNPTAGEFRWDYSAADVAAAGSFDVQFNAAWDAPAVSPARTFVTQWTVKEALG